MKTFSHVFLAYFCIHFIYGLNYVSNWDNHLLNGDKFKDFFFLTNFMIDKFDTLQNWAVSMPKAHQSSFEPGGVAYSAPAFCQVSSSFLLLGLSAGPPFTRRQCKIIRGIFLDGLIWRIPFTTEFSCHRSENIIT